MERACAVLGIKLLFAKPYSPESTGKIERFNRTVESFLDEAALKNCKGLEDYITNILMCGCRSVTISESTAV
jgi:transposase InsO family protein